MPSQWGKRSNRKNKRAVQKNRTAQDYKYKLPMVLHDDGLNAYNELDKRFNGIGRTKRVVVNIALMLLAKVAREKKLGPRDPVEELLEL
jgi:hypothetical protein